ncbi:HpcH/HpaI aldolase family protein [Celeribacter sp.]|uniref:HpcH/HpaI aldolase family protein n=1 Tax=Celeribacter sp. TaxID=1890673 RepID=UPI003A928434
MTYLRDAVSKRIPLRGPFVAIPTPMTVEIVAGANPDFICIDTEHSPISDGLLTDMLRAADIARVPAIVRVRSNLPQNISAALDAGACGVLVPHISTADEARAVVKAARFAPHGTRGAGPGRAASYLRDIEASIERARKETFVAIQLETLQAVQNVDDILSVAGIDLVFIGPGDLGVDAEAHACDDTLDALIERLVSSAQVAGVPVGIFTADRSASKRWLSRLSFVIEGSDALFLTHASDAAAAALD